MPSPQVPEVGSRWRNKLTGTIYTVEGFECGDVVVRDSPERWAFGWVLANFLDNCTPVAPQEERDGEGTK